MAWLTCKCISEGQAAICNQPARECGIWSKKTMAITCNVVSDLGIIIAQFKCSTQGVADALEFVKYDDRMFQRKHRHGGGEPAFCEIGYYELSKNDVIGMQPL